MNKTELFTRVAADVKGGTSPTVGTNEYTQWTEFADDEYTKWAEVHDWPELKVNWQPTLLQSGTSIALPVTFKKITGHPSNLAEEVDSDTFEILNSNNNVFKVGYDNGWYMQFKTASATTMPINVPLIAYPSALSTGTSQIVMRNPVYLSTRLKFRILQKRQDPIFTEIEAEADKLLNQMIENEYYKHDQYRGERLTREQEQGFELGLD
jgi:hypothetical protein